MADSGDGGQAHAWEDELYKKVLTEIAANGDEKSARLARVALGAAELKYERWYG